MTEEVAIVEPFGARGGRYAVTRATKRKYDIACAIAGLGAGAVSVAFVIKVSLFVCLAIMISALVVIIWLCVAVAKEGRKL